MTPLLFVFLQTAQEPSLFDKPQFVEGKFEAAVDAGAHASAGPAARTIVPPIGILKLPPARPTASAEHDRALGLETQGQAVEAAKLFARAVQLDPSPTHILDAAVHLIAHGASGPAAKILAEGLRLHPADTNLRLALGLAQFGLGQYDAAMNEFLAAKDSRAWEGLALLAEADARLACKLVEPLAASPYHQAVALLRCADPNAARAELLLKKALLEQSGQERAHFELARLYLAQQKSADAQRELQAVLRLNPDHELAHYRLAQLHQREGRRAAADPHFAAYRRLHATRLEAEEAERKSRVLLTETSPR